MHRQHNTVFLPATDIFAEPDIPVILPTLYPFGLPYWPYPSGWPPGPLYPPSGSAPQTTATNAHPLPTPTQLLDAINAEVKPNYYITEVARSVDAEIEAELAKHSGTASGADARKEAIEALAVRRWDEFALIESNTLQLLGFHPRWRSPATLIETYEQRYGKIADAPQLFVQRVTQSYAASRVRDDAALRLYYLSTLLKGSTLEEIQARVQARAAAKAAALAEAAAKADAERLAAEAQLVRIANTYPASGAAASAGTLITVAGAVASELSTFSLRSVLATAIGALAGFTASVGAGLAVGVSALFYSTRLGNGELPLRYALQTPLSDLDPSASDALATAQSASSEIDLSYRFSSRSTAEGGSEIFVVKTDATVVPTRTRVLRATYDSTQGLYTATTAEIPARTLTWTPAVSPGNSSTELPPEQTAPPIYNGATLTPIDVRIDGYPGVADASFDDYVIIFPVDAGLAPIYVMFRDRREEPGTMTGQGQPDAQVWLEDANQNEGVAIPTRIADKLRGRSFSSWKRAREAIWTTVSEDAILVSQFNKGNQALLRAGNAPKVIPAERIGKREAFEIHHVIPIHSGGEVYDLDNLRITTPKLHIQIHSKGGGIQ